MADPGVADPGVADPGVNQDNPPPYSPPGYPNTQPPPYTPTDTNKGGPAQPPYSTNYGTAYDGQPKPETYPPGAPPFTATEATPVHNSTTLLLSRERKPPTYFILSIITCLCFSPLFGILAIIFSALSDAAWSSGDTQGAQRYSQVAITLSVAGILITVFTLIIIFATGVIHFDRM